MKGLTKSIKRTPFNVTSKLGMSKKSNDPEFDDYQRHFSTMEKAVEKFLKDTKSFTDAINSLFTSGAGFATHFSTLFHPIAGEYDLIGKHPDAGHTIRAVSKYETAMEELRSAVGPELELIESRVVGPMKDFQVVMKTIRKTITKRDHKLVDYDRFNNSLTKLRDKKEKSLSDEKNLFKLEQDFELATNEYDYLNNALKNDLPRFMTLSTQFIDPLFSSFYYMQLNIFYVIHEKMNSFADENKFDISNVPGSQIAGEYEEKRTDAWSTIEDLNIVKRIISTCKSTSSIFFISQLMYLAAKMVQANRANGGGSTLSRSATTSSATSSLAPPGSRGLGRMSSTGSFKKVPPPIPGSSSASSMAAAAPPPYTPAAAVAATKRAPPPPPPLKPKPKVVPRVQYVVALYDYAAQADGDLSFNTGDRIEVVERGKSAEDWWTGRLNGVQGVFPGNYVQDA
ncbi:Bar adaptor protein [Mycena indigotica]|uniref:Bar adaptor protein n=1 Tax=Mycena indigotica TaxID=2126181 RepID=A0A8H6SYX5_9AGAR|nr:Bar adaptor protein [Mycena indigotica]KAF7306460.1 Bar adaptor protein [Mycena indigotica]